MKVVELKKPVDTDIVAQLEALLSDAKDGEITEFSYIAMKRNGEHVSFLSKTADNMMRVGQVCRLLHRVNLSVDRDSYEAR